jgi:hypothetical protein
MLWGRAGYARSESIQRHTSSGEFRAASRVHAQGMPELGNEIARHPLIRSFRDSREGFCRCNAAAELEKGGVLYPRAQ